MLRSVLRDRLACSVCVCMELHDENVVVCVQIDLLSSSSACLSPRNTYTPLNQVTTPLSSTLVFDSTGGAADEE